MKLDLLGLIGACSYALDCVEAELVHVTSRHAKRVAYMSICVAEQMGLPREEMPGLTISALLHDNALTQYIQEELKNDIPQGTEEKEFPRIGVHCELGEKNLQELPFYEKIRNVVLYHHENADGSGPFGKTWKEVPVFSRIIHLTDLLDLSCGSKNFNDVTWEKVNQFLERVGGRIVDEECVNAYQQAFTKEHFYTLGGEDLETRLWSKVPRTEQELSFEQIKALAKFFARIVDYKSPFTSTHSIGVAEDAEQLTRFLGFDEDTAEKMYLAGALHDIGKVAIGNEILEKPGKLTDEEYAKMKHHAAYTYYILSGIEGFDEMRDWAAFHHERLDGTGYPFGKTAEELNTQERIMACVDIYQALTESRPYKDGMPHEKACNILKDMAGRGWLDAELVTQVEKCFQPQKES